MPSLSFLEYIRGVDIKGTKLVLTTTPDHNSERGNPHEFNLSEAEGLENIRGADLVIGFLDDVAQENYTLDFFKKQKGDIRSDRRLRLNRFLAKMTTDERKVYCKNVLEGHEVSGYEKVSELRAGTFARQTAKV